MAFDSKAGFDPVVMKQKALEKLAKQTREERLTRAKVKHDQVCECDPKYLMSCTKYAQAILDTANG